ncbi:MAG: hypothetical protein CMJ64_15235 [Planctomycetaceae bacterium]|nr:hypothetical protein [Planctomycetaceae bacterium]
MAHTVTSMVVLLVMSAAPQSDDPTWYLRQDTWYESLIESREALLMHESHEAEAAGTTVAPRLGPWSCLGPLSISPGNAALKARILKERQSDFDADYRTGPDGSKQQWILHPEYKDGWIHKLHSGEHVAYLRRNVASSAAVTLPIFVDAMGEMTVWLNGEQVAAKRNGQIAYNLGTGDVQVKPTPVQLKLQAGDNDLLVKIELHPKPRRPDDHDPWRKYTLEARRPWGTVFTGHSTRSGPATEYEKLVYREVSNFYCSTAETPGPIVDASKLKREQLWQLLQRDFVDDASRHEMDRERKQGLWTWDWSPGHVRELAGRYAEVIRRTELHAQGRQFAAQVNDQGALWPVRELYHCAEATEFGEQCARNAEFRKTLMHQIASLRLAITDLIETHGQAYQTGPDYLARLSAVEVLAKQAASEQHPELFAEAHAKLGVLRREALLANPLLDFDQLAVVKRRANPFVPDLPMNWANNSSIAANESDNEIAILSPVGSGCELTTLFKPDGRRFVGDVDLHFDGDRLLFSMPGSHDQWQVFEIRTDGSGLRQVTRGDQTDVDNFDACYLPNGKVMFCSTAVFAGVPCVRGRDYVGVLFVMDEDGGNIRQLGFEQDQDYCPTVLNDGRVLYTRWEYTDIPHFFSRLLFSMNPDGTDQKSYYGSNSYWPNSIFYARPLPGHASQVVGVVSGHHAARRSGELVLFDPARGQHEADGVVQRIPGRGQKVEPVINDRLVVGSWPKFLHPFPLSDKYFLVSCRMSEESRWGIYLVDVFDNMLPLYEDEDHDLLEPIPVRARSQPAVIPDRVDRNRKDAIINLGDIYAGPGLAGVPRGTVKNLRVIAYHYAYQDMADDSRAIGVDSSWDTVKMVLGTAPVHKDGSAMFRVPANTPITVQPLDHQGKAVQLMRSWMTAMPGETLSCVGCHAPPNAVPSARQTLAVQHGPSAIKSWYGPARGFSFKREVQPVLEKYCVGCHAKKGSAKKGSGVFSAKHPPGRSGKRLLTPFSLAERESSDPRGFSPSYLELHRFVRRPGAETDYHLLPAAEYHADVSELVQLLEKGHHNVQLDTEAWDRLITWIDLNVPFHGTWHEAQGKDRVGDQDSRRRELRKLYAGLDEDPEEVIIPVRLDAIEPIVPEPVFQESAPVVDVPGWPFDAAEAKRRQVAAGRATTRTVDLGDGVVMHLVRIPAGEFVMGDATGHADERPRRQRIAKPFWIAKFEVTNQQFAKFDPAHDSRYIRTHGIVSTRGYRVNLPEQPVVRVSWNQAREFCQWLSDRTDEKFTLPTEAMWEYACRAGTATRLSYGDLDTDFSAHANLADKQVEHLRDYSHSSKLAWMPRDSRYDDGVMVTGSVGSYWPNAWGLFDMHGNAAEWTRSAYSSTNADRTDSAVARRLVVRGGSWRDRAERSRSAFRLGYPAWQKVYNVGFRVVCEIHEPGG